MQNICGIDTTLSSFYFQKIVKKKLQNLGEMEPQKFLKGWGRDGDYVIKGALASHIHRPRHYTMKTAIHQQVRNNHQNTTYCMGTYLKPVK